MKDCQGERNTEPIIMSEFKIGTSPVTSPGTTSNTETPLTSNSGWITMKETSSMTTTETKLSIITLLFIFTVFIITLSLVSVQLFKHRKPKSKTESSVNEVDPNQFNLNWD